LWKQVADPKELLQPNGGPKTLRGESLNAALNASGRSTSARDHPEYLKEADRAPVSPSMISPVTDQVLADVEEWRKRRLDAVYPILQ
jgi:transposase-like protein